MHIKINYYYVFLHGYKTNLYEILYSFQNFNARIIFNQHLLKKNKSKISNAYKQLKYFENYIIHKIQHRYKCLVKSFYIYFIYELHHKT